MDSPDAYAAYAVIKLTLTFCVAENKYDDTGPSVSGCVLREVGIFLVRISEFQVFSVRSHGVHKHYYLILCFTILRIGTSYDFGP